VHFLAEEKWSLKGHDDNYGNNRADELANEGRESNLIMRIDRIENHPVLQDCVRLQALEAKHIYDAILKWQSRKTNPIPNQETMDEAKDRVEETTGLWPTNEKILKGFKTLGISPRLRDHMRWMLTGRIKCGAYWVNIPGYADRAHCSSCKKRRKFDTMESEQYMWLECENNGQALAWETARSIWQKTTSRTWPNISTGLIKGIAALSFEDDLSKDSERLRILVSMTIWAI